MNKTIDQAGADWLASVGSSREKKTLETYRTAFRFFSDSLASRSIQPQRAPISALNERSFVGLIEDLHDLAVSTERLYITAIKRFFFYLSAEDLLSINREKIEQFISQRARRPGVRLPEFPEVEISRVIRWVEKLMPVQEKAGRQQLIDLRDRALILTLADTGLRIHEACKMRRGDISWKDEIGNVIGKRNKQAVVQFSRRSLRAVKMYLDARAISPLSPSNIPMIDQPIFTRHDRAAGKTLKAISTTAGREIVDRAVMRALGEVQVTITPHKFRHYFVTAMLRETNDLHLTMELARHSNVNTTAGYAHKTNQSRKAAYRKAMKEV